VAAEETEMFRNTEAVMTPQEGGELVDRPNSQKSDQA
jgi:hypothetical protein